MFININQYTLFDTTNYNPNATHSQKGLDAVTNHVTDPDIQRKIDSKSDQNNKKLNWTKLLDWVHEAIIQNVGKLGPNDHVNKAKGFELPAVGALKQYISILIKRG